MVREVITVEESTRRLNAVVNEITGNELTLQELFHKANYIKYQLTLAEKTEATSLIKAWKELKESVNQQYRTSNAGLYTN